MAIALVVLCNAAVDSLAPSPGARHLLSSGWMGVDLFFVLSGWLVGGLYWRERERFGTVHVGRFWARRWLRTVPPYLVALHVVFVAKRFVTGSGEPYDAGYLLFVQNYAPTIPYWAVSWSLCVEEHVYLALPLVLGAAARVRRGVLPVLGAIAVASFAARLMASSGPIDGISGPLYTQTHLRLEGIVLGVAASYVHARLPDVWAGLAGACRRLAVPALAALTLVAALPAAAAMRAGFTLVDVSMAVLLVAVAGARPLPGASSRAVRAVALTSYSVYMTHTAVLEGVSRVAGALPPGAAFGLALVLVGIVGAAFYALVERPTLRLRERWAPRRAGAPSLSGASVAAVTLPSGSAAAAAPAPRQWGRASAPG